jgi:tetratricopeptide (TPR) repeat protein
MEGHAVRDSKLTAITPLPEPHGGLLASDALQLATRLHREGNLDEAARLYRETLSIAPGHFGALCGIGAISGQQGRIDDALLALGAAARVAHDSADAQAGIGRILFAFNRFEEAIERYRCALAIDPDHVDAHRSLAKALREPKAAIAHYLKVLAVEPDHAEAHNNVGSALQRLGKWEEALSYHKKALLLKPDLAEAHASLGNAYRVLDRPEQAVTHYRKALEIRPDDAEVHNDLAGVFHKLGLNDAALTHYQRAVAIKPEYAEACCNLGDVLHELGRQGEAILQYDKALRLRPSFAEAHHGLANVLRNRGHYRDAIKCYQAAVALKPGYAEAHHNLGKALLALDRHAEAIAEYEKALAIDPSNAVVRNDLGTAHMVTGNIPAACDAYEKALAWAPRNTMVHLNLARLRRFTADDPRLAALEKLAEDASSLNENAQIALHFALGKALTDINQNERSFRHLLAGNRLKRGKVSYDEKKTLAAFDRIRDLFTAGLMQAKRGGGDPSSIPVFIVGMPRSGSSLLEQILSSHSRVFGAGEIDALQRAVVRRLAVDPGTVRQFSEMVSTVSQDELGRLGRDYIESVTALAPGVDRIVDKMLTNFSHVGLIHLALPNARIIHARRDPVDSCLSCFGLLFADEQSHTYDLAELGRYYSAYAGLMRHWEEVLPDGVMLDVRYEDVVDDIEGQARRVIAHCGLEWEEQCLAFHQTKRPVRTASVTQVRRPIYRDSVGRWRPDKALLEPLLEALDIAR